MKSMLSSALVGINIYARLDEERDFKERVFVIDPSFTKLTWMAKNRLQFLLLADVAVCG